MSNLISKICCLSAVLIFYGSIAVKGQSKAPSPSSIKEISIQECYEWTNNNYPLIRQLSIIERSVQYNLSNASNGNLPQISLNGQATYQSDVTEIPIDIPNLEINAIDKDQYKIYAEVYQPLTNFSSIKTNKKVIEKNGQIDQQKIEVDLYQLKERVNQIYFGVLLIDKKIKQFKIIQSDIDSAMTKIKAAIINGTSTQTDQQLLYVERISIDQQIEENQANQIAFLEMLSTLTGKQISVSTKLIKPSSVVLPSIIRRPELQLFDLQNESINLQANQLKNSLLPNVGLFIQGGYGRPALNALSNDFNLYYIGGLKFNWNLSSLYNYKNTKRNLSLNSDKINTQKEVFLLNTSLTQSQQTAEIKKYQQLIKSDYTIIRIREDVLRTAKVQLDNGLITTIDYVKFLNDVNQARQILLLHETQLLLAQYNLKTTTGN